MKRTFICLVAVLCLGVGLAHAQGTYIQKGAKTPVDGCVLSNDGACLNLLTTVGGSGSTSQDVQGAGASGATTVGNPVLFGCAFETSPTTVTSGQSNNFHCDSSGRPLVVGAFAPGTASANTLGGMPMLCDSATSGTVSAGQAQMPRCGVDGVMSTVADSSATDGFSAALGGARNASGAIRLPQVVLGLFNGSGTLYDRARSASLASFPTSQTPTARNSIGASITEKGSRWSVPSAPAVSTQASASIAAEASVRHVVDCVSFSATNGASAATAAVLTINIRDGATGAGTVIWSFTVAPQITPAINTSLIAPYTVCGLNLVGTTNTAMTAEFGALLTNANESISMSGFNVN